MSPEGKLDGTEPIGQDEIVFRRVKVSDYIKSNDYLSPSAFEPRKMDKTGISVCRANYFPESTVTEKAQAAAAMAFEGSEWYVVEMSASDLRLAGMSVAPKPTQSFLGHAEIPILNSDGIGLDKINELIDKASVLPRKVHGPYPGKSPKQIRPKP